MKFIKVVKSNDKDFEITMEFAKSILDGDMTRMIDYCNGIKKLLQEDKLYNETCLEITNAVTQFFDTVRNLKQK